MTPEDALAHPTWTMGPKITVDSATLANKGLELLEAHFLFDLPYDRIEVAIHPTSIVHAIVRLRDGAALAHLGYPDMRVPISFALTYPERAATPLQQLDFAPASRSSSRLPTSRRSRCSRSRARRGRGRHLSVRLQRRERGRRAGVPGGPDPVPRHRRRGRGRPRARRRRAGPRRRGAGRGRPKGPQSRSSGMSIFVAIIGLAFLILIHEAGHFFTALAVGMRPRKFYIGFPPPLVRVRRRGIEYGIGTIPLGGYVKIPGMHRPAARDLDYRLQQRDQERARARQAGRGGEAAARARRLRRRRASRSTSSTRRCVRPNQPTDGSTDVRDALRARRVLAAARLEEGARHLRGPGDEHCCSRSSSSPSSS